MSTESGYAWSPPAGLAAGMPIRDLAGFMGTSLEQIDKTYGHMLTDAFDRGRVALEAFDAAAAEAASQ